MNKVGELQAMSQLYNGDASTHSGVSQFMRYFIIFIY